MVALLRSCLLLPILALAACSAPAPEPEPFDALRAPILSPPGSWPLEERLAWWEERVDTLGSGDREEALLRIGQLQLEVGDAPAARESFRRASYGRLSERENAQAEYGVGLSYLLEGRTDAAVRPLRSALDGLSGPEREECEALYSVARGRQVEADALVLARVSRYVPSGSAELVPRTSSARSAFAVDVSRASWRARPLRGNHKPMLPPTRITVHHSAEPFTSQALSATCAEVHRIQGTHQNANRWADIGYHFLIDPAGRVIEGRELSYQGAHAYGDNNKANIGICLLGNFVPQPDRGSEYSVAQRPSLEQVQALEELVRELREHYGIRRNAVFHHAKFRDTACPGPYLTGWVKQYQVGP